MVGRAVQRRWRPVEAANGADGDAPVVREGFSRPAAQNSTKRSPNQQDRSAHVCLLPRGDQMRNRQPSCSTIGLNCSRRRAPQCWRALCTWSVRFRRRVRTIGATGNTGRTPDVISMHSYPVQPPR